MPNTPALTIGGPGAVEGGLHIEAGMLFALPLTITRFTDQATRDMRMDAL